MAKKKKRKANGYVTVKIPEGLAKKIDELIKKKKYSSRTTVVKKAIWNLYDEEIKNVYRVYIKNAKK